MKLCSWSTEGFRSLISVIEVYEVFETRDVTKKGRYGALLANGEKLRMSNSLFNSLAKCDEKFFQDTLERIENDSREDDEDSEDEDDEDDEEEEQEEDGEDDQQAEDD